MAAKKVSMLYLETMEETRKESKESHSIGYTRMVSNCRKAYWHMAKNGHVQRAISKERLVQAGYYSILDRYESLHLCD